VAYIWHAGTKAGIVQDSLAACGFETRSQIIWAKNNFAIGRGHYHCKHEPCWYVVRKGSTASWVGDHSQTTLWQIDKNLKSETGHGTQKPVECMRRPIENNASPGQAVYEPFSGSGTTIITAEMTGGVCHAIEIAPAYVDGAVKRWQEFTGQQAVLDGDGRSFDNVSERRVCRASLARFLHCGNDRHLRSGRLIRLGQASSHGLAQAGYIKIGAEGPAQIAIDHLRILRRPQPEKQAGCGLALAEPPQQVTHAGGTAADIDERDAHHRDPRKVERGDAGARDRLERHDAGL
jgi:hypothetical protein